MRITPHRQLVIGSFFAQRNTNDRTQLQGQISSGIRVQRPSDDPRAQKLILDQSVLIQNLKTQSRAIDDGRTILNDAHVQIRSAQQLTVQARDIALQSRQISDPGEAQALANEIDSILNTLDVIANSQQGGRYLFSGQDLQTRPYANVGQDSVYQGAEKPGELLLPGVGQVATYYSGQDVFTSGLQGVTLVQGTTGAIGGTGTGTIAGSGQLLVQHTQTTYEPTAGVTPGTSSVSRDTIIGATGVHQLQIIDTSGTGASGTVSLNGGPPIAFTNTDTDLVVTGPNGAVVSLNTTAIAPGFSGSVDITADGTLSIDDGQTNTPIDFSANQALVDGQGRLRYLDSQNITRTGQDSIELEGATDLFATLQSLRDDLNNYSQLDSQTRNEKLDRHLDALEVANDHLLNIIGEQSVTLESLDRLQTRASDLQFEAEQLLSDTQSTDIVDAVSKLQEATNQNQFALATLAGVFQTSILDFLR